MLLVPLDKKAPCVDQLGDGHRLLSHQGWEEVGGLQEGGLVLAQEDVVGCCEAKGRYVWLKLWPCDVGFDKHVKCVQCGMISGWKESFCRHLKTIHFATKMCDVIGEVSIFVAFFEVPCINIPLSWAGEFTKVDGFLVVVNDYNIRLLHSHP